MKVKSLKLKGFTLIEMLIAVAIISALVSVAAMRALSSVEDSKIADCWANINTVTRAAQAYKLDTGLTPTIVDDLQNYLTLKPKCRIESPAVDYYFIAGTTIVGDDKTDAGNDNYHWHGKTNYPFIDDNGGVPREEGVSYRIVE